MELLVHLNNLDMLPKLENKKVDIVVGLEYYSSRAIVSLSVEQLKALHYQGNVYVLVNRLFEQKEIEGLRKTLNDLKDSTIKGLIFQDFAVISICQKDHLPFDLIYNSDTLNTNHASINTLGSIGIKGAMLASQLHEDEVRLICKYANIDLFIQIHGKQYISHSKRKLLSNYFQFNELKHETDYDAKIVMKVHDMDTYSHIYEDRFGTHVFTQNELCLKDYLSSLNFKYGYLETIYLEDDYILALIDYYRSEKTYQDLCEQYPDHHYDTGFFADGTVYKLEDVRKRDANEKR